MPSNPKLHTQNYWSIFFGVCTVGCLIMTGWALTQGRSLVRILVLGALTFYAFSNFVATFQHRYPHFKRLAAIPLGIVGLIAYLLGAPTDLPIFFILLGGGSLIDLLWDPTGKVYSNSE